MALIEELFPGAVDIVGDVHGEMDALESLLQQLGYRTNGGHAGGRRLVFVGDLVDRGPDSPAVLDRVQSLVEAGRAQCILGNHELNLLKDDRKPENAWWMAPDESARHPARSIDPAAKPGLVAFMSRMPLVLERADLRVVHACWNHKSIKKLRALSADGTSVVELNRRFIQTMHDRHRGSDLSAAYAREWQAHGDRVADHDWDPVFMPAKATMESEYQMANPVAVLTAGEEAATDRPFWAGGKWRMVDRVKWWERYDDPVPVIVGHYWRRYSDARLHLADHFGPDLFEGIGPHQWMGRRRNVYCIDFSVGARASQRANHAPPYVCKLAALRIPEWEVLHDDGEIWRIGAPGRASDNG
jgi:hypothetical protein